MQLAIFKPGSQLLRNCMSSVPIQCLSIDPLPSNSPCLGKGIQFTWDASHMEHHMGKPFVWHFNTSDTTFQIRPHSDSEGDKQFSFSHDSRSILQEIAFLLAGADKIVTPQKIVFAPAGCVGIRWFPGIFLDAFRLLLSRVDYASTATVVFQKLFLYSTDLEFILSWNNEIVAES